MKCLHCGAQFSQDHPKHFFCKDTWCYNAYADRWREEKRSEGRYIADTAFGMLGGFGFMGDRDVIRELHRDIDRHAKETRAR